MDYESIIYRDVAEHYCKYGEPPSTIMISRRLLEILASYYGLSEYDTSDGIRYMFHGMEVKPYHSDKLEYYLVTRGRELY